MTIPQQKVPGPDHPITIEAAPGRMQGAYMGHVIADSANVLLLREASYPPVAYFPRGDVDMSFLTRSDHHTHCPYKGEASYYTLNMDGQLTKNAVWSYEEPYEAMEAIRGRLAFYPVVEVRAVEDEARGSAEKDSERARVDDIVRHTDRGDGASQADAWAPNVVQPRG